MIHTGDCIEVMAGMDADSVDAIVTDPPYGLEFMGKEWDRFGAQKMTKVVSAEPRPPDNPWQKEASSYGYGKAPGAFQAWCEAWGREALRVAKPGAYLLAFGGTRTHHRLVCGLEDAGWIIRDELDWIYASGFPKGKANLKPAHEPIVLARKPGPLRPLAIDECRIGTSKDVPASPGGKERPLYGDGWTGQSAGSDGMDPNLGRWPSNVLLSEPALFDERNAEVVGSGAVVSSHDTTGIWSARPGRLGQTTAPGWGMQTIGADDRVAGRADSGGYSRFFLIPKADRADREPIVRDYALALHRERGECDKLGAWDSADQSPDGQTGSTSPARAISVATPTDAPPSDTSPPGNLPTDPSRTATSSTTSTATSRTTGSTTSSSSMASPTSASTPAANSGTGNGSSPAASADSSSLWPTGISAAKDGPSMDAAEPATSSRWSSPRNCGDCGKPLPRVSTHPTHKPVDLMRHLVRLVTPQGGTVLDPFLGSGSTAIAAELEGFPWLGIEKEPEYVAIAEARLVHTQRGLGL